MEGSTYPVEMAHGVPVVTAPDEIDITDAPSLRSAMLEAASCGNGTLVVDMTQTRFCDSSGLHALFEAHARAQAQGGELLLAGVSPAVLRVFALTGLSTIFTHLPSLDEALARATVHSQNGRGRTEDREETVLVPDQAASSSAGASG